MHIRSLGVLCAHSTIQHDALMKSKNFSFRLTGGAWSPTRPGVFYIIKWNGNIDVWDLLEK